MPELGIVDTRTIIKTISEKYQLDFSDYALTSFKQRVERSIDMHNIRHVDIFINKLQEDSQFFEVFLNELEVPSTEMFRDPSLWRILREDLLPALMRENPCLRIWLPNSVSGDELYSLCILIKELNLTDQVKIFVSTLSRKSQETIQSGFFPNDKVSISVDNYKRANGAGTLEDYLTTVNGEVTRDTGLIRNVTFARQQIIPDGVPQGVKLVLFRNKMIYFNQTLQGKVLRNLEQNVGSGAYLIFGTKEALNTAFGNYEFSVVNSSESIYKRR